MGLHNNGSTIQIHAIESPVGRLMLYQSGLWNYLDASHIEQPSHIGEKEVASDELLGHSKLQIDPKTHKNDSCYNLQLKEYQCINSSHSREESATKCVKWFSEWIQCKWDHEKMTRGYSYIEPRPERKHKAYIAAPNYQYS